jgi:hypothetical protein
MNNYEKAVEIYNEGGQYAVYEAVKRGLLDCKGWGYCSGCEDDTPTDEDKACLVCGLEVWGEIL